MLSTTYINWNIGCDLLRTSSPLQWIFLSIDSDYYLLCIYVGISYDTILSFIWNSAKIDCVVFSALFI